MIADAKLRRSLIGIALGLACLGAAPVRAQEADMAAFERLMSRDAVLVSQAIGWSLEGPVSAAEAAPVVFAPGAAPQPIATGSMASRNVMVLDSTTLPEAPNSRGLSGVVELADRLDHRVLARFDAVYDIAGGSYRVDAVRVDALYPDLPRIEGYVVPASAAAALSNLSPFAMLEAIRRSAIDPKTADAAPQAYQVYVVGMDRLSPQGDLGFAAVDAATGRQLALSKSVRRDGWVVAGMPLTFAWNGRDGVYFPVTYRPDGAAGSQRIVEMFSNRYGGGAPAAAPGAAQAAAGPAPAPLPPSPTLSPVGQGFMTKSYPNQVARP